MKNCVLIIDMSLQRPVRRSLGEGGRLESSIRWQDPSLRWDDKKRAFTLIELSIVLVIIGLIVGGVLVGQDLIKQAELRRVLTDIEKFKTAANAFRLKYNCIAGDCNNATTFFGTDSNCTSGGGTGTCNGDGNKQVAGIENYRFWEQLALAGLIEGDFTGEQGPSGAWDHVISTNVPNASLKGGGFWIAYREDDGGWGKFFNTFHGNHIILGEDVGTGSGYIYNPSLTTKEAYALDSKVDDTMPGTGHLMGSDDSGNTCASSGVPATATYRTDLSTKRCLVIFPKLF